MDVTSYLLGKKAGGGSTPTLQNKSVTITENGTTNVTADTGYDGLSKVEVTTNVSGGGGAEDYFDLTIGEGSPGTNFYNGITKMIKSIPSNITTSGSSLSYAFYNCSNLTSIPLFDTSGILTFEFAFKGCSKITQIPSFNTSRATKMNSAFASCSELTTVPVFDWSNVNIVASIFMYCNKLNDVSLDNILQSCISTSNAYTGSKTLYILFNYDYAKTVYPSSRIQALPHYQDFLNAGWKIGY